MPQYISKLILNGVTQMDVTQDTVAANNLLSGETATKNDGSPVTGTYVPASPTMQTKTKTYTPSASTQTEAVTADAGYDGLDEVDITVNAVPTFSGPIDIDVGFDTVNNQRVWKARGWVSADVGEDGYIPEGDEYGEYTYYDAIAEYTSVTPTESAQTIGGANYMMEGAVTVNAIPSNYVGSQVARNDSTDLTASGATVTAPAGYYETAASKAVAAGTEGTPAATKGAVSNHAVTVTPSVTNQAGYIAGGTKTGTGVQVTAAELVSGTLNVNSAGTKDVTNYASASVPSGSATPAASITGTAATVSTGTNTLTLSKTVSNTPQVSAGYVANGTAGNSNVSLTANVTTKAATTYHPSSNQQTIASETYLTGAQTINAVTTTNLSAANVKKGVVVQVGDSSDPDCVTAVTGEYEGESSGGYKLYISGSGSSFTVQPAGESRQNFVDGTVYNFDEGDSIIFRVVDGGTIYYNGTQVARNLASTVSYTLTAPGVNITATANEDDYTINIDSWVNPSNILPLSVTENGIYTAPAGSAYTPITVNVSGSGGASNLVQGTFTAQSSAGVQSVSIPYTGTGYPIAAMVFVSGGAYNSGNSTWYNSTQRYAVGQWTMSKSVISSTPTYTTSGTQNQGVTTAIYKNSTSSSTSYTRTSAMNTNVFSSSNATNAAATCVRFKSRTSLSVYINTSSYGLLPGLEYQYIVVYSS